MSPKVQKPEEEKVACRPPTAGKRATRIPKTKFDLVRRAILKVVPRRGEGVRFADLGGLVGSNLTRAELASLGSLLWHVTTVKLELEVRGEIERVPGSVPQRLRRPST